MASQHLSDEDLAGLALAGSADAHADECPVCGAQLVAFQTLITELRALPDPPERLVEAATAFYRRRRALEALLERLAEDPGFRAKARAAPEKILRDAGLEPDPELIEALRSEGRATGELARRLAAKQFRP